MKCPKCGKESWVEVWTAMIPPRLEHRRCCFCGYEEKARPYDDVVDCSGYSKTEVTKTTKRYVEEKVK